MTDVKRFVSAEAVWPENFEKEMNISGGFRAVFNPAAGAEVIFKVATSGIYRFFLNGEFKGAGPARGPHGYYRIDEWELKDLKYGEANLIAIEVAGYNVNSYYILDQISFLAAEIISDGKVLAATGKNSFEASLLSERVQKSQRYSFQRTFSEVYRLKPGFDLWRSDINADFKKSVCSIQETKSFIPRRLPFSLFSIRFPENVISSGKMEKISAPEKLIKDRSLTEVGELYKGFKEAELETVPSVELQYFKSDIGKEIEKYIPDADLKLSKESFHIFDFAVNLTGFIGIKVKCTENIRLYLTFDEILDESGDVNFKRMSCVNVVTYFLSPGEYSLETIEPYTMRYLKIIVLDGGSTINGLYLKEYVNPDVNEARFSAADKDLNKIFESGRETFRQNALDIFMDCPSRERAGWLCDSFFTSRAAFDLSGHALIEKNFLENYLLPEKFPHLPEGMLPMSYPSDQKNGRFIPQWAMWFVIELEEYQKRSQDYELVNSLKNRVFALFEYFKQFHNSDGLLEKLPSWNFIEWSKANEFVHDVNYPTNALYAAALETAGRLYNVPEMIKDAAVKRDTILKQSFNGEFFIDNAIRKNDKLKITGNRTEVCQYYIFYFNVASPETHSKLWDTLKDDFGPFRTDKFPDVHKANAFIGNYLRLELLSRYGLAGQIIDESRGYLLKMADRTGTLWEMDNTIASCNHGFASHINHVFYRDILGLYDIDEKNKVITLRFSDIPMEYCEGRIPHGADNIYLKWQNNNGTLNYQLKAPESFSVKIINNGLKEIVNKA